MTADAFEPECAVAARDWRPDARLTFDPHRSLLTLNFGHATAVDTDMLQQIIEAGPQWVRQGGDPRWLESALKSFEQAMRRATFEWEIYYTRSEDGGQSWSSVTRLTHADRTSLRPNLAATGDDLHVVWFDGRNGDTEIYYKRSRDAGRTWGPDVRVTHSRAEASLPSIAVADGIVHVVWSDTRDGNPEIYYKRSAAAARGP